MSTDMQNDIVIVDDVTMHYRVPKKYVDYLCHPLRKIQFTALKNVSLKISKGACLGLLGPNGAGKTTLLKLIGGLILPSQGWVKVDGYNTRRHNQWARARVGFILNEERSFYWRLTGAQNLEFFGTLENLSRRVLRSRIDRLLELVGLRDAANVRVSRYSCGMRQRLAIARGLLKEPEVLILDEPTKSLDPLGAQELRALILDQLYDEETTLVVATHQIEEAETLCHEVCVVMSGAIVGRRLCHPSAAGRSGLDEYYKTLVVSS